MADIISDRSGFCVFSIGYRRIPALSKRKMTCKALVAEIRSRLENSAGKTIQDVAGLVGLDVTYLGDMKYGVKDK